MSSNNIQQYQALYEFIKRNCIADGDFILSSGKRTTRYFDLRILTLNGNWGHLITHAIRNELFKHGISVYQFDSVGGMESGAIPLISTLVNSWGKYGFYVKKLTKDHGTLKSVEGIIGTNDYLLVDDVVTTGESMKKAIEIITFAPIAKICIVDRMIEQHYGLISLFRESDFLNESS